MSLLILTEKGCGDRERGRERDSWRREMGADQDTKTKMLAFVGEASEMGRRWKVDSESAHSGGLEEETRRTYTDLSCKTGIVRPGTLALRLFSRRITIGQVVNPSKGHAGEIKMISTTLFPPFILPLRPLS